MQQHSLSLDESEFAGLAKSLSTDAPDKQQSLADSLPLNALNPFSRVTTI